VVGIEREVCVRQHHLIGDGEKNIKNDEFAVKMIHCWVVFVMVGFSMRTLVMCVVGW
jgi:hypothetical protein